jgi:hypothetical protein
MQTEVEIAVSDSQGLTKFLINGSIEDTVADIQKFSQRWFKKTLRKHQIKWLRFFFQPIDISHLESPRRHGKSMLVRVVLLWLICQDPFIRILVASNTESLSTSIIRHIQRIIESNAKEFLELYGVEPGKPWRGTEMCLLSEDMIHTDAVLIGKAGSARVTGLSTDVILMDDIIVPDNIRTQQQYRRLKEWIEGELWNTLDPMIEKVIILGTRKGMIDWYNELLNNPDISCHVDQAIIDEGTPEARPLWPKEGDIEGRGFTMNMLEKRRRRNPTLFEREWMNRPSLPKGYRFERHWIKTFVALPPPEFMDYYIGIDPGAGIGDRASYFAITVVAHDRRGDDIYIVEMYRDRMALDDQIEIAEALSKKYEPKAVMCESVFAYSFLADEFEKRISQHTDYFRKVNYKEGEGALKGTDQKSKEARIESRLRPLFRKGQIFTRDAEIDHFTRIFIERELLQFGGGGGTLGTEMDMLDSLVLAIDEIENYAASSNRPAVWTA